MKKIKSIIIAFALFFLLEFVFFKVFCLVSNRYIIKLTEWSYFIFLLIFIFLFVQNLLYQRKYSFKSKKVKIFAYLLISFLLSFHLAGRINAMNNFYFYSKNKPKGTTQGLWQFDEFLAHKAIPNSKGFYEYNVGDSISGKIPVYFDSLGYRTVTPNSKINADTLNLFLGCSFTFGDYIEAKHTYPHLVSKKLDNNYINTGASAYGFGQMIQLIDSLIPKYDFKYVFIQMSPWLADRAMKLTGPTFYGYRPFPYFSDKQDSFKLNYPVFKSKMYKNKDLRETKPNYFERVQFFFTQGKNIEIMDYYTFNWNRFKSGIINKPTIRKKELEKYFYDYAINSCRKSGATPIILKLRYENDDCADIVDFIESKEVQVINLDYSLNELSQHNSLKYQALFSIYHKLENDSILIDGHPNNYAMELFSETIINNIKK